MLRGERGWKVTDKKLWQMSQEIEKHLQATEGMTAKNLTQAIKIACDKVFLKKRHHRGGQPVY